MNSFEQHLIPPPFSISGPHYELWLHQPGTLPVSDSVGMRHLFDYCFWETIAFSSRWSFDYSWMPTAWTAICNLRCVKLSPLSEWLIFITEIREINSRYPRIVYNTHVSERDRNDHKSQLNNFVYPEHENCRKHRVPICSSSIFH